MKSLLFLFSILTITDGIPFKHDVDFEHPESGERVNLHSSGHLTNAVDLDRITGIKRVICEESKVLIAAETNAIAKDWKEGQVILGSSKWDCHRNTLDSQTKGIYAKIKAVYFPTETGIVVHTEKAGAFDIIDEADIKFHYHPGNESSHPPDVRRRHRRYLANVLSQLLHDIDWKANFSSTIPWNYDLKTKTSGPSFKISPMTTDNSYGVHFGETNTTDGEEVFTFNCTRCHGFSTFSYTFEMVIRKNVMNQPNIHHYLSKLETNTSMNLETALFANAGMKVEFSKSILDTPLEILFTIPVAVVDDARVPPVTLTVNYCSKTHVNINLTAADAVTSHHKYNITGSYEIVQEYTTNQGMQGYVNVDNWSVRPIIAETRTTKDLQLSTAVFQKLNFTTTIGWFARDMEINFSPPVGFRIVPTVNSVSSTSDVMRCTVDQLNIDGDFNVSDARLIVDAFEVPIWNTLLAEGFNRSVNITKEEIFKSCRADCFSPIPDFTGITPEEIVGPMKHKILRNSTSFDKLYQVIGNSILFTSEEADMSTWCGYPGRPCVQCRTKIAGHSDTLKCADRLMTSTLASKTSLLGKYVRAEWPERKLIVHEAWDEPTSLNRNGEQGNISLHYEGRAAIVSVSSNINEPVSITDNNQSLSSKLQSLAECSGFPYVSQKMDSNLVQVAVKEKVVRHMKRKETSPVNSKDKQAFEKALAKLYFLVTLDTCPDIEIIPSNHWPPMYKTEIEACGDTSYKITREDDSAMKRLYEYSGTDVEFEDEGSEDSECGLGRACKKCDKPSMAESTWDWCSTRSMTPRLALRLKRLSVLVQKDTTLKGGKIKVIKSFSDDQGFSSLYSTGRALKFTYLNSTGIQGTTQETNRLVSLSVCAGFDFVRYLTDNFVEVFVKEQAGYRTSLNSYPSGEVLITVDPPLHKSDEYSFPVSTEHESRKPALLRPLGDKIKLSKHFKTGEFKDKSTPYMRIDSALVECLEMTRQNFKQRLYVLKGYTTKSSNTEINSEWNQGQLDRFQIGQAVVIQEEEQSTEKAIELAKLLMSTCTPNLRLQRRGLSLSIKENGICREKSVLSHAKYCLYVGLYPLERSPQRQYIKLTTSMKVSRKDGRNSWEDLKEYRSELLSGGPQIMPYNVQKSCERPELGDQNAHLSFKLHHIGFCLSFTRNKRCDKSRFARSLESEKLWKQISSTVSSGTLPAGEMQRVISSCLEEVCGGCPGAGPKWDKKVKACVKLVDKYLSYTRKPLVKDTDHVALFNTDNDKSAVHGLACQDDKTCVENIQLYSILQTTLAAKYKPDVNSSIEEPVFDGHDNPSPLLEIIEQHVAKQAKGNVTVYIENLRDISVLRNILKVLMIFNRDVDHVRFLTLQRVNKDKLASAIQRKLETWAGGSCPKWSRFAVAPYIVEMVPPAREIRSIENGRHRNKIKEKERNWEIDWILMT